MASATGETGGIGSAIEGTGSIGVRRMWGAEVVSGTGETGSIAVGKMRDG